MYTRYSGVDVPQNYSGNRFRKKIIEDTETKVHSSITPGAVKSSVSPSFESQIKNDQIYQNNDENSLDYSETLDDVVENDDFNESAYQSNNEPKDKGNDKIVNKSILNELNLSPIAEYLKSIRGEDLLLIALIIFLASDKNISNNDIIILLALLLVYHT